MLSDTRTYDPAGIAAYRALALLASAPHDRADLAYLQAAVLEPVRLRPTTRRCGFGQCAGPLAGSRVRLIELMQ